MIALMLTGTRTGMSLEQRTSVRSLVSSMLATYGTVIAHHGDCIGADADFHAICRELGVTIHGHPPANPQARAFCTFDVEHDPAQYMDRNYAMVQLADRIIATPSEPAEKTRSGTWATVRMARRAKKKIAIVEPDGFVRIEEAR
jgi:hypothetical protein